MIIKNATFGKTENTIVCELGAGDVFMLGSKKGNNGEVILALKTIEPREIGIKRKTDINSFDELQPEIVFIFNKIESLDALIDTLLDCRTEMLS